MLYVLSDKYTSNKKDRSQLWKVSHTLKVMVSRTLKVGIEFPSIYF
jgi:hypothetical protein